MLRSLVHVGLSVVDFDKMRDFYTRVLGLQVTQLRERPDGKRTALLSAGDGEVMELIRYVDTKNPREDVRDTGWAGINHFGFVVDDIEAELERLRPLGVIFEEETGYHRSPSGALVAYFWDPEGNRLHLSQIGPATSPKS